MRICALGDLLLDVIVRLDESLAPGADARAETRLGAGIGAGREPLVEADDHVQ